MFSRQVGFPLRVSMRNKSYSNKNKLPSLVTFMYLKIVDYIRLYFCYR